MSPEYAAALAAVKAAADKFRPVRDAYFARKIDDAEFLAARAEYTAAQAAFDAASAKEAGW
jgi:hypothetical protein